MYTSAFHFTQAFRGQLTSLSRLSDEATFALVPVSRTLAGSGEKTPTFTRFPQLRAAARGCRP